MLTVILVKASAVLVVTAWFLLLRSTIIMLAYRNYPDHGNIGMLLTARTIWFFMVFAANYGLTSRVHGGLAGSRLQEPNQLFLLCIGWVGLLLLLAVAEDCLAQISCQFGSANLTGWVFSLSGVKLVENTQVKRTWLDRILGVKYFYNGVAVRRFRKKGNNGELLEVTLVMKATDKADPSRFWNNVRNKVSSFSVDLDYLMSTLPDVNEISETLMRSCVNGEQAKPLVAEIQCAKLYLKPLLLVKNGALA